MTMIADGCRSIASTTTMALSSPNLAPVLLISSLITFIVITLYFPLLLYRTVAANLPHVDRYTELGRRRGRREMQREYERMLAKDRNPLAFLYQPYRRRYGFEKAKYLWVKGSVLFCVAVITKGRSFGFRDALKCGKTDVQYLR